MTFQDDNGNLLEVQGDFSMTKKCVSIFDGSLQGDVSINFDVDNNSFNRKVLNYDGPQMLNQVAFTKQPFNRMRNGNILDRGFIVIQSEDDDVLNCFYGSGNSNWIQLVQGLITTLDFSNYAVTLDRTSVLSQALATEGIIFPLVDWCYNLKKGSSVSFMDGSKVAQSRFIVDVTNNIDNPFFDFYPCFYMSTLVKEIASQNGIKISGTLLDDSIYKSLIITPRSGLIKRQPFKDVNAVGSSQAIGAAATVRYTSFTEVNDPDNLFSSNRYTSNKKAGLYFTVKVVTMSAGFGSVGAYIYKNGVAVDSFTILANGDSYKYPLITSVPNDYFDVYIINPGAGINVTLNVKIETTEIIGVYDYVSAENFLPTIKGIDIVKFLINYFGCSVYFDQYSKTVTINIIERIKPESSYDWSEYYVSHRSEYTVSQAQHNYMKWQYDDFDSKISSYNNLNDLDYGNGDIPTGNTLKYENDLMNFPFSPASFGLCNDNFYKTNVPLINLIDDGDPVPFTAVADNGASAATGYNLIGYTVADTSIFNTSSLPNKYEIVRISNANGINLGYFLILNIVSATEFNVIGDFTGTTTGNIYRQTINYNDVKSRILSVKPNTAISDVSNETTLFLSGGASASNETTIPYAVFTKGKTGYNIDNWKNNLAIDNINSFDYVDPTIKQLYFNKISKFLQNPNIRAKMTLPESVYQGFKFDQFIYLKTEKLTGYFFVQSIVNYVDGNTPVEVNLYML